MIPKILSAGRHKSFRQEPLVGFIYDSSLQGPPTGIACFYTFVFYLQMQFSPKKMHFSPTKYILVRKIAV
jgi:hypothetical protein